MHKLLNLFVMDEQVPTPAPGRAGRMARRWLLGGVLGVVGGAFAHAADTSPAQQLSHWSAQAGRPGQVAQGQAFFNQKHGGEWSCASCHGTPPTSPGKHANTGKSIAPLAPAFNPKAFTDTAKVEKWFRRNCNDVLSRECTATEKADVLAYLNSLKP
ncbi:MAG: hypothetical protein RJA09_1436 [Pseudomonadota bacterium]|jgi:hypothetical protein